MNKAIFICLTQADFNAELQFVVYIQTKTF